MADARDLKSLAKYLACGFESRLRHQCVNRRRTNLKIKDGGLYTFKKGIVLIVK